MRLDPLSTPQKVAQLASDLASFHHYDQFHRLTTMGDILWHHIHACLIRSSR